MLLINFIINDGSETIVDDDGGGNSNHKYNKIN